MDLRTRYTALVTLTTQHVKYISDALRRLEEEEVRASHGAELYSKRAGSFPNAPTDAAPCWGYTSGAAPETLSAFGNLGPPLTWLSFLPPLFAESSGGGEAGARGQGEGAPGLGPGREAECARQDGCCWEQRAGRHREIHLGAAGKAGGDRPAVCLTSALFPQLN